jgi:NADH-quinone oxidoreductase subunit G
MQRVTCDREIDQSRLRPLRAMLHHHCPTGALSERDDTMKAYRAWANPDIITVVQVAPAVRAAWGEDLGISREFATVKRLVAALRKIGFNYIFDTDFAADLTIIEEGNEFVRRKFNNEEPNRYPLFTSCCPAWVRFMKSQYPDMMEHFSTTKSPQQMFGCRCKVILCRHPKRSTPPEYSSSPLCPVPLRKRRADYPSMDSTGTGPDVDLDLIDT